MARGKKKKGYRQSVFQDHIQHLPAAKGWMKKRNPQGLWQRRWFTLNNHYLVYYKDDSCKDLRGSIDLLQVADARAVSRFGDIELIMASADMYPLKCVEERQSGVWVQAIKARIEHYSKAGVGASQSMGERPSDAERFQEQEQERESEATADVKTGWLLKRSPHRHNKFQERFVRLGEGALQYFKKASDPQPHGVIPLDSLRFVRPFSSDPSCVTFELRYEDRTFVFNAQTNAEMASWVRTIEKHWEGARQQTEAATRQTALMAIPFRVRHFDEVGADEFLGELRYEVLQLFQGSTVPETIQSLNQALDLLEDLITDCELVRGQPVRSDIMAAGLRCVHDCMEINLSPLLANTALDEMSLEELYQLIDWIGAHHAQIGRLARHILQAELPQFTIYNEIPRLCEFYLHGPKGSSKMLHDHVQRILSHLIANRLEMITSKENGKVFTHAPIDIWEMLHQHISLATSTQSETLHVLIIHEIGQALFSVAKTLEDYLEKIFASTIKRNQQQQQQQQQQDQASQQEGMLEFLCAVANDMVVHTTEIADVVADFEADEIKGKLDEAMDKAVKRLLECGQLAITKLARFVMLDTEAMLQAVYSTAWLKASNMDVVVATAQDYLNDLTNFLSPYWSNKIVNTVLLELVAGYATAISSKARSVSMKAIGGSVNPPEATAQLAADIQTFRQSFEATTPASILDAYLLPLQDIASILSAPAEELSDIAATIAARGAPLDTLVVAVIQQLYPLRDDSRRRSKSERERVVADCSNRITEAVEVPAAGVDTTRTSAIFTRMVDGAPGGLFLKLTRNFSSRSDSVNRPSSPSRDSIDSDQQEDDDESNQLLVEILELARKTDRRVEGASTNAPLQIAHAADNDADDNLPGTKILRSGMIQKLSKRHVWITRWFDLLAVRKDSGELLHVLGWSKKQSQVDYTATCLLSDITRIVVLQSPRPLVYAPQQEKVMLDIAACPGEEVVEVAAQRRGDASPGGGAHGSKAEAQQTYDFALTMAGRADDMVLRVKSVDDLIDWVNAIAAVGRLVYDPMTGSWSVHAETPRSKQTMGNTRSSTGASAHAESATPTPALSTVAAPSSPAATTSPKAAFNPKARMKTRMQQSGSVDKTSSSPPKQTPPTQDDSTVFSPFHAGAGATGSHAPHSTQADTTSGGNATDRMSDQPVRASESSLGADSGDFQEKFSISISSSRDVEHEKYDDGRVVEVRSSWCCWR